jgi:uncharacterized Zn ribbon protein
MAKITLEGFQCERCRHEWVARGAEEPKVCPKCKTPYWNTPKKQKQPELLTNNDENNIDVRKGTQRCKGAEGMKAI